MTPTIPLTDRAREFWDRNAPRLIAAKILTDADVDSFVVLCQTWAKLQRLQEVETGKDNYREMVQLASMLKQYYALAGQFGLLPRQRKQAKMDLKPPVVKDEFGL